MYTPIDSMLFRFFLGACLRDVRLSKGWSLRVVASSAGVSGGYLSEIERGQKEASSELLAAVCGALGVSLSKVLAEVSIRLADSEAAVLRLAA